MKFGLVLGVVCAVVLHVGVILFGGVFFMHDEVDHGTLTVVKLMSDEEIAEEEKEPEKEPEADPAATESELETEVEEVPDAEEIIRSIELSAAAAMPELEAASLSAIEAALSGTGAGNSDFAQSLDFSSGGRIGGTGKGGPMAQAMESAFDLAEIDQQPRAIFQAAPTYPSSMRGKKIEGVVTLRFIVDANGKVESPRVEKTTHSAFDKPALDALKNWKFEPAIKSGQRVACPMRVSVRFQPS